MDLRVQRFLFPWDVFEGLGANVWAGDRFGRRGATVPPPVILASTGRAWKFPSSLWFSGRPQSCPSPPVSTLITGESPPRPPPSFLCLQLLPMRVSTSRRLPSIRLARPRFVMTAECESPVVLHHRFTVTYTLLNNLQDFLAVRLVWTPESAAIGEQLCFEQSGAVARAGKTRQAQVWNEQKQLFRRCSVYLLLGAEEW